MPLPRPAAAPRLLAASSTYSTLERVRNRNRMDTRTGCMSFVLGTADMQAGGFVMSVGAACVQTTMEYANGGC